MTLSLRKTMAVFKLKTLTLISNKTLLFGPIFSILFTLMFQKILPVPPKMVGSEELLHGVYLNIGVIMNTLMTGLMVSALSLAEEKEKHTLRVLMTSSINWVEYFLGSLLPVFILTEAVNLLLIPICGVHITSILYYVLLTSVGVLISILIGAGIGLASKDQTATSLVMTPIMMLMLLPAMLGNLTGIAWMATLSQFTYTGAMTNMMSTVVSNKTGSGMAVNIAVFLGWLAIAVIAFGLLYKNNGKDKA